MRLQNSLHPGVCLCLGVLLCLSVLTFLLTLAFTLRGCVSLKACDNYCTTEIEILSILYIIPLFVCVCACVIDAQQS